MRCGAKPGCTEGCVAGVTVGMWYFSWILGLGLALTFGVLNAIWYEIVEDNRPGDAGTRPG
jgi:cytochrome bd-I ubiquinol oxidase subunit X